MLAALAPSGVLFVVTLAGGGLVTFLPIERPDGVLATVALLLFGLTGALTRWRAGLLADRLGSRRLMPLALAVAARGDGAHGGRALGRAGLGLARLRRLRGRFRRDAEPDPAGGLRAGRRGGHDDGQRDVEHLLRRRHRRRGAGAGPARRGVGLDATYVVVAALLAAAVPLASAAARAAVHS